MMSDAMKEKDSAVDQEMKIFLKIVPHSQMKRLGRGREILHADFDARTLYISDRVMQPGLNVSFQPEEESEVVNIQYVEKTP